MQTRRITLLAVLLAVSVVLNIVERIALQALMQPLFFVLGPLLGAGGVRIGLANVVVMAVLYTYGMRDAFVLLILRIFLVGLLAVGLFSLPFFTSLMGGLVAFCLMVVFKNLKGFTIVSVSVMGAIGHVFGQVFVAVVFFSLLEIVIYTPFLLLVAVPAGVITAEITRRVIRYLAPFMHQETA